jgi:hypothetical protein
MGENVHLLTSRRMFLHDIIFKSGSAKHDVNASRHVQMAPLNRARQSVALHKSFLKRKISIGHCSMDDKYELDSLCMSNRRDCLDYYTLFYVPQEKIAFIWKHPHYR